MLVMNTTLDISCGVFHDQRIETLMAYTIKGNIHHDDYDTLLHEVVTEFIGNTPMFFASKIDKQDGTVLVYLAALGFDMTVANIRGPQWPGLFKYLPEATYAVSLCYPHPDEDGDNVWADFAPGTTINLAALAGLIQLAREVCEVAYNQGTLPLSAVKH